MVEESQAQAKQANLPISNANLIAMSNRSIVVTNNYPDETKSWENWRPPSARGPSGSPPTRRPTPHPNAVRPSEQRKALPLGDFR